MKSCKYFLILIMILFSEYLFAQKDNFQKDSIILLKESVKLFRNSSFYNKKDGYKIKFIYYFDLENDVNIKDTLNNNYVNSLVPIYTYRHYYTFFLKIPRKKRLIAEGFVFSQKDTLVSKIVSLHLYPFLTNNYIPENIKVAINDVFIKNRFDKVFKLGYFSNDIWWCIKNNKTYIYNVEDRTFYLLSDFYKCCWNKYKKNEIEIGDYHSNKFIE